VDEKGEKIEYEVYFDVTRAATRKGWLYLTVQSAYARTRNRAGARPARRKILFETIARNRQMGKKIRPGR